MVAIKKQCPCIQFRKKVVDTEKTFTFTALHWLLNHLRVHHPGPHASLGPSWRVMIVRPSGLGTAAARRTVAEPPHTPLGVIHTLRSPPARPYEASRNSKNRSRRQPAASRARLRRPSRPRRRCRPWRPALRVSDAPKGAVGGMEHTGMRWLRRRSRPVPQRHL